MEEINTNIKPKLVFILSNKKKQLLSIDDYIYQHNKSTENVSYWKCEEISCGAGVHLYPNKEFKKFTKHHHNHMPVPERVEVRQLMMNIKKRVLSETTAIGQIYNEELAKADLSKPALAMASSARNANSGLNQARRLTTPNLPTAINFDIPTQYKTTNDGKRYLLVDRVQKCDGEVFNRILIFATDDQLKTLFNSTHIMMDGTFHSSPSHFHQVYTIHAMKNDHSFLCVTALLGNRTAATYKELFAILTEHAGRLNLQFRPQKITSDFEAALIKTIADQLPNTRHVGCNFHFVNAINRQIQQLGLVADFRNDESVRSCSRELMALALVPIDALEIAFKEVVRESPSSLKPLLDYFDRYWMTKVKWTLWNVSDVEMKTNNFVEGWNHRFNRLVSKYNPNVWHLFDCLKKEEVLVRQQMLKMITGEKKDKCKKVLLRQERISFIQMQFNEGQINLSELLEGLSLLIGATK
ncbi:unnamed protein product [Adineta ricciae]|uniref:MULE transposase domain-containing protein n=1 Tax=Adineta ricciae TaxID=249248 RepID=A0A814QW88_ADIRI|nr:unnamed protein product [Adineta ricciae]CAF1288595.1 unnamed protein product [Adineta ricciae]